MIYKVGYLAKPKMITEIKRPVTGCLVLNKDEYVELSEQEYNTIIQNGLVERDLLILKVLDEPIKEDLEPIAEEEENSETEDVENEEIKPRRRGRPRKS